MNKNANRFKPLIIICKLKLRRKKCINWRLMRRGENFKNKLSSSRVSSLRSNSIQFSLPKLSQNFNWKIRKQDKYLNYSKISRHVNKETPNSPNKWKRQRANSIFFSKKCKIKCSLWISSITKLLNRSRRVMNRAELQS